MPKPKPLRDIRYFESPEPPAFGLPMPGYAGKLFQLPKSAIALGQRIAMKCEELGVSIGRADHLYLCFTPALADDAFARTDYAIETWHRYALHGLHEDFNALSDGEKLARVGEATFRALAGLSGPEDSGEPAAGMAHALATVRAGIEAQGEALRIVIKRKQTRRYAVRVEQTVPVHPRQTPLFLVITDLASGVTKDTQVAEVRFYDEAPSLIDRIAIVGDVLTIHPRKSFRAELVTKPYTVPIEVDLAGLFAR
jgi:hypothetical protein